MSYLQSMKFPFIKMIVYLWSRYQSTKQFIQSVVTTNWTQEKCRECSAREETNKCNLSSCVRDISFRVRYKMSEPSSITLHEEDAVRNVFHHLCKHHTVIGQKLRCIKVIFSKPRMVLSCKDCFWWETCYLNSSLICRIGTVLLWEP